MKLFKVKIKNKVINDKNTGARTFFYKEQVKFLLKQR